MAALNAVCAWIHGPFCEMQQKHFDANHVWYGPGMRVYSGVLGRVLAWRVGDGRLVPFPLSVRTWMEYTVSGSRFWKMCPLSETCV